MSNKKYGKKVFLGYRGFSAQSLLALTAFIEYSTHAKDLIFFKMSKGIKQNSGGFTYSTNNPNEHIKMSLNAISIRALAYALKELLKTKASSYEEITKSANMKKITLGYAKEKNEDRFYINTFNIDTKVNIGVSMNKWEMASFADSLMIMADETEKALYKFQRMLSKAQSTNQSE